ncbi:TSUP family transporter [Paraburkholderia fungorum]|uniref:TSUP family transporter n=1 Tax=Paraburkholderia fungorum TaxID=134537 RepID=UPI0038BD2975
MNWGAFFLLVGAGILGSIINALAGGATLITFPAMLAVGLPPVIANASNAIAISPGHLLAALADRQKLPAFSPRLLWLVAAASSGGAAGAVISFAYQQTITGPRFEPDIVGRHVFRICRGWLEFAHAERQHWGRRQRLLGVRQCLPAAGAD